MILCISITTQTHAQENIGQVPHPKFSPFKGTLYELPELRSNRGKDGKLINIGIQEYYSDTIYHYPVLGEITLDKIDVPETIIGEGKFPGVDKTVKFGMILHSQMEILVDGCFEFTLSSDDGSRLWIDENQVVNNDGGHKLKTKIDSIALKKGMYDAKLWYFQGMPDRFGFMMDAKIVGKQEVCPNKIDKAPITKITLSNMLFLYDKFDIQHHALEELEAAVVKIKENKSLKITIIGHTDNRGSLDYNQALSLKRAQSVKSALENLLEDNSIELIAIGLGDTVPVASNENSEGRKLNRRVELILE